MGRRNTVEVSNLGQFNFLEQYGDLKLKEFYFVTGQHLAGSCFCLGAVTFHDKLFCRFSYVVPVVKTNTAELLADSVITILQDACLSNALTLA